MRFFVCVLILCCVAYSQKRFEPEYFIKKHNLKLPKVTEKMLDVSELTHTSDLWEYYYQGKTEKLDSVVRYLTIERFQPSRRIQKYSYSTDSVIVREISVSAVSGDTLNNWMTIFKDDFRNEMALDLKTNCLFHSKFDERGIKLLDVSKSPGDTGFTGQVFKLEKRETYLECIPIKSGVIDSNNIRRYYLSPFDSIVADFLVEKSSKPVFFNFITYNPQKKPEYKYLFNVFNKLNPIVSFNYHVYDKSGRLKRIYLYDTKDWDRPEKEYVISNYTEYEYDTLGRKVRSTTRVKPDPKESKAEEKK